MSRRRAIAVIGPGQADAREQATAREVGRLLAEAGLVVLTGGLGGVMESASRGAADAGGTVVGVLPGDDADSANPFVGIAVPTGMGQARNAVLINSADAVIAIGKGYGTLSEIAIALRAGKRVVGIGTWEIAGVRVVTSSKEAVDAVLGGSA